MGDVDIHVAVSDTGLGVRSDGVLNTRVYCIEYSG